MDCTLFLRKRIAGADVARWNMVRSLYTKLDRAWPRSRPVGAVLMYHRVCTPECDPWRLSVSPENFEAHLALLAKETVIPLSDLPHTPGGIAITFDDGYADNVTTALPLLTKYNMPATIFIATNAFAAREFWWDRIEHALSKRVRKRQGLHGILDLIKERRHIQWLGGRLRDATADELEHVLRGIGDVPDAATSSCSGHRMMSESEVRKMAASPLIEIGAHTQSHPCLPRLSGAEQLNEMIKSRNILESLTGRPVTSFAYPYGAHDDTTVHAVREAGFERACIVGGGLVRTTTNPFRIPRLMVRNLPEVAFAAQLHAWRALRWLA